MWQRRVREPGQPACWLYRPTEGAESGGAPKVSQVLRALRPDPPRKSGWFNKQNRRPVCDVRVLPEDMKPSGEVRWFLHVTSAVIFFPPWITKKDQQLPFPVLLICSENSLFCICVSQFELCGLPGFWGEYLSFTTSFREPRGRWYLWDGDFPSPSPPPQKSEFT